jgi:Abortive infection alpha
MDSERVDEAHPAFAILVRQLSPDEAKILAALIAQKFDLVYVLDLDTIAPLLRGSRKVEIDTLPRDGLVDPQNVSVYFDHLDKLGLASVVQERQEPVMSDADPRMQVGIRLRCKYSLTEFGQQFVRACVEGD